MTKEQKAQYGELYSKCIQLKLLSADGKRYATDCFAQEDIIEVVKTLPAMTALLQKVSPKTQLAYLSSIMVHTNI